jgi:hypothetical protein
MLPGLYDTDRRSLKRFAIMLIAGGVAVLPLTTQSSSIAGAAAAPGDTYDAGLARPTRLTFPGFSLSRDPFVPTQAIREKLEAGSGAAPTGLAPYAPAPVAPIVRAIVVGDPPRALVEEDGTVRVLALGDRIGTLRITAITTEGLTLSDGSHLLLAIPRQ